MSKLKKFKDRKGNSTSHLYRDVETDIFYAVIRIGKKVEKQSLETRETLEALRRLPSALDKLGRPKTVRGEKEAAKLCRDYWNELIAVKVAEGIRPSTIKRANETWRSHLDPFLGNWRSDQINKGILTDFVVWEKKRFPGAQLFNSYKYMKNLFLFMVKRDALLLSQLPDFKLPKKEKAHHDKKKGRVISDAERKALRSHGSIRISLIIGFGDVLGMRKKEIVALEKSRLVYENGRVLIALSEDDTKTGLARRIGVPRSLEEMLRQQIDRSGSSRFVFPATKTEGFISLNQIDSEWFAVKKLAKINGRLRFHDLRHSRATEFARQNINPAIACTILGMSLRMYQKVYLNLSDRDLLDAIDSLEARR